MRTRIGFAATLLLFGACASGADTWSVTVGDVGSSLADGVIAVAARVRVEAPETPGPVRLQVTFRDADGARIDETNDDLPYCPVRTDCWWAATFPVDQFERPDEIRTADVESVGRTTSYNGEARVLPFPVSRRVDGRVHGIAPGDEGYIYLIGMIDGEVRGGMFTSVTPEGDRNVYFTASNIAVLGRSAELRAYFYPLRVPRGH